ncbi:hypothetical protein [Pleurocapsa sp. FMAR1]|uniref:hypothetical protein n=1 Tax=Pleurocapsa sp. FMAR1 TaxID=3040204 RepID=UPI0029C983C2|nr:hypothetical protein [Pleurocapsa sp. FMAR1]
MKKVIYLSTAVLFLIFPSVTKAEASNDLTPSEVFCSNTNAKSGNAIAEINKMVGATSNRLSMDEKQVLRTMAGTLDSNETIQNICYPAAF